MRHERHECNTSATLAKRVLHETTRADTSATLTTGERHECYTNNASAARGKTFDFDNDTSKNKFSHPIWQVKEYKERKNFIIRITF